MSIETEIEGNSLVDVSQDGPVEVSGNSQVSVVAPDALEVEGSKHEYAIVGDAYFPTVHEGDPPSWIVNYVDIVTNIKFENILNEGLQDYRDDILAWLENMEIKQNAYDMQIIEILNEQFSYTSRLETLHAGFLGAEAAIANFASTYATTDQAYTMMANMLQASVDGGTIRAEISRLDTAYADLDQAFADSYALYVAQMEDLGIAQAEVMVTTIATRAALAASWGYNSTLRLANGDFYKSGFGLKTELKLGGDGSESDPYTSEFWINADKLVFTNAETSVGDVPAVKPFVIDATPGEEPTVTFTGNVVIRNRANAIEGMEGVPAYMGELPDLDEPGLVPGDTGEYQDQMYVWTGFHWSLMEGGEGVPGEDAEYLLIKLNTGVFVVTKEGDLDPNTAPIDWFLETQLEMSAVEVFAEGVRASDGARIALQHWGFSYNLDFGSLDISQIPDATDYSEIVFWASSAGGFQVDIQSVYRVREGSDGITVLLDNESHGFRKGTTGVIPGSNAELIVYEGARKLNPSPSGPLQPGQYRAMSQTLYPATGWSGNALMPSRRGWGNISIQSSLSDTLEQIYRDLTTEVCTLSGELIEITRRQTFNIVAAGEKGSGFYRFGVANSSSYNTLINNWGSSTPATTVPMDDATRPPGVSGNLSIGGYFDQIGGLSQWDVLTVYDATDTEKAVTKMWNGTVWVEPALSVHGDMVVEGTIRTEHVHANGISADKISAGTIEVSDTLEVKNLKAKNIGDFLTSSVVFQQDFTGSQGYFGNNNHFTVTLPNSRSNLGHQIAGAVIIEVRRFSGTHPTSARLRFAALDNRWVLRADGTQPNNFIREVRLEDDAALLASLGVGGGRVWRGTVYGGQATSYSGGQLRQAYDINSSGTVLNRTVSVLRTSAVMMGSPVTYPIGYRYWWAWNAPDPEDSGIKDGFLLGRAEQAVASTQQVPVDIQTIGLSRIYTIPVVDIGPDGLGIKNSREYVLSTTRNGGAADSLRIISIQGYIMGLL